MRNALILSPLNEECFDFIFPEWECFNFTSLEQEGFDFSSFE